MQQLQKPRSLKTQYKWVFIKDRKSKGKDPRKECKDSAIVLSPYLGKRVQYHLPKGTKPGKWQGTIRPVALCRKGWHTCDRRHLYKNFHPCYHSGPGSFAVFKVDVRGPYDGNYWKYCWASIQFVKEVTLTARERDLVVKYNGGVTQWDIKRKRFVFGG